MARVLLYSTVPIIAKGFSVVLSSAPEFELVSICADARQLPQSITVTDPDLIVIDVDETMSFDRLFELRHGMPARTKVVLWIQSITPELAFQTMRLGIRGILRKSLGTDVMLRCLQKVAAGESWFEETLTASFLDMKTVQLSRRESQLISLVSQGLRNKEISEVLMIAEQTVKIYLSRLFKKVGAKDRFELALYGLRNVITGQVNLLGDGVEMPAVAPARRAPLLVVAEDTSLRPTDRRLGPINVRSA